MTVGWLDVDSMTNDGGGGDNLHRKGPTDNMALANLGECVKRNEMDAVQSFQDVWKMISKNGAQKMQAREPRPDHISRRERQQDSCLIKSAA